MQVAEKAQTPKLHPVGTNCDGCVPVGAPEIAELLGVERTTVNQWRYRKVLPDPKWVVHGYPAWDRDVIIRWAQMTGRWNPDG